MLRFLLVIVGICLGLGIALVSAEMIEKTGGEEFCSSCHSMEGVAAAYRNSLHGENNRAGVKAECVDCHLPHNTVFHYVTAKAYSGAKDVLGRLF